MRVVEHAAGGELTIDGASLTFPLTTSMTQLRLVANTREAAFTVQRAVVKPRWISLPSKTLWIDAVELERPLLRITRTKAGTWVWPVIRISPSIEPILASTQPAGTNPAAWQIHVASLNIVDGVVELLDEKPSTPFHGVLDHVTLALGPVTVPLNGGSWTSGGMSFAVRGKVIGDQGAAAPLYCSGWLDLSVNDLQASCRLEPLALAAFEPYYHGPAELRVYTTTLTATSLWSARSNEFNSRLQLELGDLTEGDFSVRGRTIIDLKRLTGGQAPHLSGEISMSGLLTEPAKWRAEFIAGDEPVQGLVKRLLDRNVQALRLSMFGSQSRVYLTPSNKQAMTDIEATSREVQEALELLASSPQEATVAAAAPVSPPALGEATLPVATPESAVQVGAAAASPAAPAAPPALQPVSSSPPEHAASPAR